MKSKYTDLSYVLKEVILLIIILKEIKNIGININTNAPKIIYKVFKDNSGTLEMASIYKF